MPNGQQAVDAMMAQGVPAETARTMLAQLVEHQSVMLATLNMLGVIAVCLGVAAMIIWLVPKPKGPIECPQWAESGTLLLRRVSPRPQLPLEKPPSPLPGLGAFSASAPFMRVSAGVTHRLCARAE